MSLNLNMTDISVPCASTGLSLTAMWTCIAHTGYFVLCAVLLTFLRCPGFSRAMLLLTVPLNAVAEVNQQPALDLTSLSLLLLTLSLGTNLKLLKRQIYCLHYSHALATIFFIFFFHICRTLVCESGVGLLPDQRKASLPAATDPMWHRGATEAAGFILPLIPTVLYAAEVSLQSSLYTVYAAV